VVGQGERIGTIIRDRRLQLGLEQRTLADQLGVNQQDISRWERHHQLPQPEHYDRLAAWLGMSRADLILVIHDAEPATDPFARLDERMAKLETALAEAVALLREAAGQPKRADPE
jgi:transcriptional regulator with XRE-family HTH domain